MGMDTVELVMAVEEEFSMTIPNDVAATLDTAGKLYEYVILNHGIDGDLNEDQIWNKLVDVIIRQLGVRREEVKKESNFVYDLGVD
jgi:acyl carrier protein